MFPYAYSILGSSEDAKDAIQDVFAAYLSSPKEEIDNVKGYLIKSVINRSITIKHKKQKLSHQEIWLPEPIATEAADTSLHLGEIISYSLLILLEQLNPKERAVFILKEGFDYAHQEIAEALSTTVEHSRKLLSRAKSKLKPLQKPVQATSVTKDATTAGLLEKYIRAIRSRDTHTLEGLLTQDIVFYADGGTHIPVVKKICTGLSTVADLLVMVYHRFQTSYSLTFAEVNHQPALLYYQGATLRACQVLGISPVERKILQISTVLDPGKLKSIDPEIPSIPA